MQRRRVVVPYDVRAERALQRVHLMRFGVPERVLNKRLPMPKSPGNDEF